MAVFGELPVVSGSLCTRLQTGCGFVNMQGLPAWPVRSAHSLSAIKGAQHTSHARTASCANAKLCSRNIVARSRSLSLWRRRHSTTSSTRSVGNPRSLKGVPGWGRPGTCDRAMGLAVVAAAFRGLRRRIAELDRLGWLADRLLHGRAWGGHRCAWRRLRLPRVLLVLRRGLWRGAIEQDQVVDDDLDAGARLARLRVLPVGSMERPAT